MGRRATFTEAQIARAMRAARSIDPDAIVEVTREGAIRILPSKAAPPPVEDEVEKWFGKG